METVYQTLAFIIDFSQQSMEGSVLFTFCVKARVWVILGYEVKA